MMAAFIGVMAILVIWVVLALLFWVVWHQFITHERSMRHASPTDHAHGNDPKRAPRR